MEIKRLEALKKSSSTYELRTKTPKQKQRDYIQPDNTVDDEDSEIFKGSIIPSDNDIECNAMTKLKNKIIKAQEEYIINNKHNNPPMYKANVLLRPEDIEPPLYEVRMKTVRQKKQDKYDKLALAAF